MVIPAMKLHGLAVQEQLAISVGPAPEAEPLRDSGAADPHRHGVHLRIFEGPGPRLRYLDRPDPCLARTRHGIHCRGLLGAECEHDHHCAGEVGRSHHYLDVHYTEVLSRWEHVRAPRPRLLGIIGHVMEQNAPEDASIVPEVTAGVDRGSGAIETVVRHDEELSCGVSGGRNREVKPPWNVAACAVLSHLLSVYEHAAVEGAAHKLQPRMAVL
mmetsp:Transcript_90552/g.216207  ORF Transcript_90552/g.216207 Transcript_90552/m.216207 type:complete len:214 (-) Transcript_90552:249-890(-)